MYLGIDPGISGAFVVVDVDCKICEHGATIEDFFEASKSMLFAPLFAYIEQQQLRHSDRKQGIMFNMQKLLINYGEWMGVLRTMNIGFETIHPLTWQKRWNCSGRMPADHRKKAYTAVARHLWPERVWLGKHHDLAAAALLAVMCRDDRRLL